MHRHTVLFNLKDDADTDAVISALQSLSELPTADALMVGANAVPPGEHSPYAWLLVADFADQAARDAYEAHETHVDIIRNVFLPAAADFIVSDLNT
jgi:hypothetical protein